MTDANRAVPSRIVVQSTSETLERRNELNAALASTQSVAMGWLIIQNYGRPSSGFALAPADLLPKERDTRAVPVIVVRNWVRSSKQISVAGQFIGSKLHVQGACDVEVW